MKIQWTARAKSNLRELQEYIAEDSPENAERFIVKIFDSVEKLTDQPKLGRQVPKPTIETMYAS